MTKISQKIFSKIQPCLRASPLTSGDAAMGGETRMCKMDYTLTSNYNELLITQLGISLDYKPLIQKESYFSLSS